MEKLIGIFDEFPFLTDADKKAFSAKLESQSYEKGGLLEEAGKTSFYLHYIKSGAARSFYVRENKDITVSFSLDGEFVTAMHSFITRKPSFENIEVLEKSVVYRISYKDLQSLKNQCKSCHNKSEEMAPIGVKVQHLNNQLDSGSGNENQLVHWKELGKLEGFL